jgi:hypothetical protein
VDIATLVLAVSTALGGGGTVFLWLETHTVGRSERRKKSIKSIVDEQIEPVKADVQQLHVKVESDVSHSRATMKQLLSEALEPVHHQLSVLNTQMEPLWRQVINNGLNQIDVLHQPDPRRAHVDVLLEKLRAEFTGGPLMTDAEVAELRGYLIKIKTWEPGMDVGFPVLPSEPSSAGQLLSIMELPRIWRDQGQKAT